nr:hypothetical protein [Micromonospora sp. DSM 115978]
MRSGVMGARADFGAGPLSRVAALIYTLLVVELLLLATSLPGLVPLVLLDRDASNLPLYAACAVPVGPAAAAALYALHHRRADLTDLGPAAQFWRGYRINLGPVLRLWIPLLVWLTVVGISLANIDAAGVPTWWAALLIGIAVGASLWGINALVITALFTFRTRDVARLALHLLGAAPVVTLGTAGLLVAAAGLTAYASEIVTALLGSVFLLLLVRVCRPLINKVREEFTA